VNEVYTASPENVYDDFKGTDVLSEKLQRLMCIEIE